jgi:hypothetical protein
VCVKRVFFFFSEKVDRSMLDKTAAELYEEIDIASEILKG